ncbi:MAG: YHS domain-containing protein [Candidatus Omnitrophica bacterium]|nr:YHS domain-containing protein [Candidatus Omnitrophota bacterium]
MFKKLFLFLIFFVFPFGFQGQAQSEDHGYIHDAAIHSTANAVENVGNKICPVMGNLIDEDTKVTYEYEGKIYNFCCESCIGEFKKDPAKYIKIIEKEKNNPQPAVSK